MKLKNLFKKKKKDSEVEPKLESLTQYPLCGICKDQMFPYQKIKKFNKQKYHIKCLRKYKRKVTQEFIN